MLPAIPVNEELFSSEKIFQKNWNRSSHQPLQPPTSPEGDLRGIQDGEKQETFCAWMLALDS